jgi:hypothetical protein
MTTFTWKIKGISAENGILTQAYYYVNGSNDQNNADTENRWNFQKEYQLTGTTKEEEIISWIKQEAIQDDINPIESRLEAQLQALKTVNITELPWIANTFTIE